MKTLNHKLMEVKKEHIYNDDRETWKSRCACGKVWYGTRKRVLNSHKWHLEHVVPFEDHQ